MRHGEEGMDAGEILRSLQGEVINWTWLIRGREDLKVTPGFAAFQSGRVVVYYHGNGPGQPILQGRRLCFRDAGLRS